MAAPSRGWSTLAGAVERVWGRVFSRRITRARRLRELGRLDEACALLCEAGASAEASELHELGAQCAAAPSDRVRHLTHAAALAHGARRRELRRQRGRLLLELVESSEFRLTRGEQGDLGRELEELGDPALAARAYALAGDTDGEARALVAAGAVDALEQLLDQRLLRERGAAERAQLSASLRDLDAIGRRREALALAVSVVEPSEELRALSRELEARRVSGPQVHLVIDGSPRDVVFGVELTVGRLEATLSVASPAVSRAHLVIRRRGSDVQVADLGSRNGTLLGGARLEVPVLLPEAGLELWLGGEVRLALEPQGGDGVSLELAGRSLLAPLGPLRLQGASLDIVDGWLELTSAAADLVLGELRVGPKLQLCRGDVVRRGRGGPPLVEVP